MTDPRFDNVKTPIYAAVGAGDAVVQAVADVVAQVRARAESTGTEVNDRVETARENAKARVDSLVDDVESLRKRLVGLPAELPEINELRESFTPEELKKVAEAYLKVAADLYSSLAVRGEETVERIRRSPGIEGSIERANAAAGEVAELTEQALGKVAAETRAIGERAAGLALNAGGKAEEVTEEISDNIEQAADRVAEEAPAKTAPAKATKTTPAAKVAPAKTTPAKKAPARKAPAKKV